MPMQNSVCTWRPTCCPLVSSRVTQAAPLKIGTFPALTQRSATFLKGPDWIFPAPRGLLRRHHQSLQCESPLDRVDTRDQAVAQENCRCEQRNTFHVVYLCNEICSSLDFFQPFQNVNTVILAQEPHKAAVDMGVGGSHGVHCVWAGTMKAQWEEAAASWAGGTYLDMSCSVRGGLHHVPQEARSLTGHAAPETAVRQRDRTAMSNHGSMFSFPKGLNTMKRW